MVNQEVSSFDERVADAFAWWRTELAQLLPERSPAWMRSRRVIDIDVSGVRAEAVLKARGKRSENELKRVSLDAVEAIAADALSPPLRGPVLRLPKNQVLSRILTMPRAAEMKLDAIIAHEFAAQMPYAASDAYYDYRIVARRRDQIDVALACVAREKLNGWLGALAAHRLTPSAVVAADTGVDLLSPLRRKRFAAGLPRRRLLALLAAVAIGAAVWTPYAARLDQNAALSAEVEALKRSARTAIALDDQIQELEDRRTRMTKALKRETPRIATLAAATEALPDDAFLRSLEISGDQVALDGEAAAAAPLIARIEGSPHFNKARFLSPVTTTTAGRERFSIGAQIVRQATLKRGRSE